MDSSNFKMAPQTSLFQVFLRLRPPMQQQNAIKPQTEPWLLVERPSRVAHDDTEEQLKPRSTHITLQPPNDSRKRAIERFGFTKVFEEDAAQLDVFEEIGALRTCTECPEEWKRRISSYTWCHRKWKGRYIGLPQILS